MWSSASPGDGKFALREAICTKGAEKIHAHEPPLHPRTQMSSNCSVAVADPDQAFGGAVKLGGAKKASLA